MRDTSHAALWNQCPMAGHCPSMNQHALRRRRLIALKNIFSRQLPNMPREYIARLVLDRRHRSVAIVRKRRTVVGGITYRPFHAQVT